MLQGVGVGFGRDEAESVDTRTAKSAVEFGQPLGVALGVMVPHGGSFQHGRAGAHLARQGLEAGAF